jgi:hypothetical protein
MFILQQNKHTIHELNQKNFENTQINLGLSSTLGFACAGKWRWLGMEVGRAREAGRGPRRRAGSGGASSGELQRTPASMARGGELQRRWQARRARERGELG